MSLPLVVGVVHSLDGLSSALALSGSGPGPDVLEIRLDAFWADDEKRETLLGSIGKLTRPLLATARHPAEGGQGNLSHTARVALLRHFMGQAAFIDIELRTIHDCPELIAEARAAGVQSVLSVHDFQDTPSLDALRRTIHEAADFGPDIIKLATRTDTPAALARLLTIMDTSAPRLAVMGMGRFGKVSRLALAQAGSALNYGFIGTSNAPGQWEAGELRALVNVL